MSVVSGSTPTTGRVGRPRLTAAGDAAVAAVAFALTLAMLAHGSGATRSLDAMGVVLAAFATVPLLAHRGRPLGVFVACTVASATIESLGYALGPPFGPTVALFYLAADRRTPERMRQIAAAVVALGAVHVGVAAVTTPGFPTIPILGAITLWGGAWIIGDQLRQRRQRIAHLRERAERAERETARERRLAVAEERNRIARDLHDSAAHAINVILVQAGGARLLQDRDPGAVSTALATIEDVARETIEEIDWLIHGLRTTGERATEQVGATHRAGLGADAGGATSCRRDDPRYAGRRAPTTVGSRRGPGGLPDSAGVLDQRRPARHRPGCGEDRLRRAPTRVDDHEPDERERSRDPVARGYGILGMRERAALLGGKLHAGTRDELFQVMASLPYAGAARARQ